MRKYTGLVSAAVFVALSGAAFSSYAECAGIGCLNTSNAWTFQEDGQYGTSPIEFMSSSNLPLSVLKLRKQYTHRGLVVGGFLETETQAWSGDKLLPGTGVGNTTATTPYQHGSTMNVSSANFDVLANINPWTQAFIQYNAASNTLESAFINLGNLSEYPVFVTIGKNRPRFGHFPAAPWAANLTQGMVRPGHINTATVAYDQNNLNVNLAAFNSKTNISGVLGSVFYHSKLTNGLRYQANLSATNDMRGLENAFSGVLTRADGAVNFEGSVGMKQVSLTGGIFTSLKKVAATQNKKANIWYAQLAYTPHILAHDVTFAVNYSQAQNTQNIAMPLAGDAKNGPSVYGAHKEWIGYVDTSITKRINVGLEFATFETYNHKHTNATTLYVAACF